MKNMNNISKKNLVFIALLAVFAIIVVVMLAPPQKLKGYVLVSALALLRSSRKQYRDGKHKGERNILE